MDLSFGINSIIAQKLSSVLETCSLWLVDNRLSLHLGKTESILLVHQENLKMLQILKFCVMVMLLKVLTVLKYLGFCIEKFLSCKNIVLSIIQKVNARLKFLYRNAYCIGTQSRMILCSVLIQCFFD